MIFAHDRKKFGVPLFKCCHPDPELVEGEGSMHLLAAPEMLVSIAPRVYRLRASPSGLNSFSKHSTTPLAHRGIVSVLAHMRRKIPAPLALQAVSFPDINRRPDSLALALL
jgi:hypothetical protein